MPHNFIRNDEEIDRVLQWAIDGNAKGTRYAGMSYESGLIDMLDWLTGITDVAPDQDE